MQVTCWSNWITLSRWPISPLPGRRWYTVSHDEGDSWEPVREWTYAGGGPFHSPSSMSQLLVHSSGDCYWIGNITPNPPDGNGPRYPLYIAEVEESVPALKKDTLTVIDDRDPDSDPERVQFSNFSVFEHPETGDVELYMTRYGETPGNIWTANAYKYTITMR